MGHKDIIEDLGGAAKVADLAGRFTGKEFKVDTVYRWQLNGVPWRWRAVVAKIAKQQGAPLPKDFMGAT
jgi:hypothetical protein